MSIPLLGITFDPRYPAKANGSLENTKNQLLKSDHHESSGYQEHPLPPQSQGDLFGDMSTKLKDVEIQRRIDEYWEYKVMNDNEAPCVATRGKKNNGHSNLKKLRNPMKRYLETHTQWEPVMKVDELLKDTNQKIFFEEKDPCLNDDIPEDPMMGKNDQFTSYLHLQGTISEKPFPPLFYHSSFSVNEDIFIIGGAKCLYDDGNPVNLDLSKYEIEHIVLPIPVNWQMLCSPTVAPNYDCYVLSSQTHVLKKFVPTGDVPPPLLCMTASLITERYCLYYGGFELISKVKETASGKVKIQYNVELNNSCYILDTRTFQFTKHDLMAHPSVTSRTPITIPRFGHTATPALIQRESEFKPDVEHPATVYLMGGYRLKDLSHTSFEAIEDLWKLEVNVIFRGTRGYLEFDKEVIATPIPTPDGAPVGRAFHVAKVFDAEATLYDENNVFMACYEKSNAAAQGAAAAGGGEEVGGNYGIKSPVRSDSPPQISISSTRHSVSRNGFKFTPNSATQFTEYTPEPLSKLKLIIHGGTNGVEFHGDVWWFDFETEKWHEVETYFNDIDENFALKDTLRPAIVKKCAHTAFIFDKYMVLVVGVIPSDFTQNRRRAKAADISELFIMLKDTEKREIDQQYHRFFVLNLESRTWSLYKCYHDFTTNIPGLQSQLSYIGMCGGVAHVTNSRVYYIGGIFKCNVKFLENVRRDVFNNVIDLIDFPLSSFSTEAYLLGKVYIKGLQYPIESSR